MVENVLYSEAWVKRRGVEYAQLRVASASPPTVRMDLSAEVKMSCTCSVEFPDGGAFDYVNDVLVLYVVLNGAKAKFGEYLITASQEVNDGYSTEIQLSAFDITHRAYKSKTENRVFFTAGSLYTNAVEQMLVLSGLTNFVITPSALTFATDREDWDPGTTRLAIINQLLQEMNYNTLCMNLDGVVIASPYQNPYFMTPTIIYTNNQV